MTECEKVICKMYLEDMHDNCNENRLLLQMLEAEPCEDAISRQAALDEIISRLGISGEKYLLESERYIYQIIKDLPPVTPKQRTGHWIEQEDYNLDTFYDCSECGESFYLIYGTPTDNMYNYCPNCGAKMEG